MYFCYSTFISSIKTSVILTICVVSMISLFACSEQSRREEVGEDLSEEETTGRALTVQTTCFGATVYDVESKITVPIEDGLSALDGIIEMRSISKQGICSVVLEFEPDVDLDRATVAVRAKLDAIVLPDDSARPVILRHDVDTSPVITLFVLGNVDRISWVSKLLRDKYLQNIKGVSEVQLIGVRDREMQIILDPNKLRAFGSNAEDILIALRSVKATEQESIQDQAEEEYPAKVIDELAEYEVANIDDVPIRIRDVARVNYVEKVPTSRCRLRRDHDERGIILNGEDRAAVAAQIYKDSDADAETVIKEISEKLGEIKSQLPDSVEIWTDDAVEGISRMKGEERIIIRIVAPPDFRRGEIDRLAIAAENLLERHPGCSYIYTLITNNPGEEKIARFFIGLVDSEFRQQIMESVSEFFSKIPVLVGVEVRNSLDLLGGPLLNFSLKGDDLDMLTRYADRITTQLAKDPGLLNLSTSSSFEKETIEFHLDQDRLARLGVSSSSVDTAIRCFLEGVYVTELDKEEEHIDVRLFIGNPDDTQDLSDLRELMVFSGTGKEVPLDSLVSIIRGSGPTNIRRRSGKREVLIYCDPAPGTSLREAAEIIRRVTKKLELPPGCEFEPVGQTKRQLRDS